MNINYKITELCKLAYKYGTDKCPQVNGAYYTPFYFELLKDKRETFCKVTPTCSKKTACSVTVTRWIRVPETEGATPSRLTSCSFVKLTLL